MNLRSAYKNGWKVIYRALVFYVCLAVGYAPVAILAYLARLFGYSVNEVVEWFFVMIAIFGYMPICFHFASWYSGEFKNNKIQQSNGRNRS